MSARTLSQRNSALDGRIAQRRDAFLGTLAYDPDETACRVHIVHIQIESFGNTQPGTVEQFRQRQIAGVPGRARGP